MQDVTDCLNTDSSPCIEWAKTAGNLSINVDVYLSYLLTSYPNIDLKPDVRNTFTKWNAIAARNPHLQPIAAAKALSARCEMGTNGPASLCTDERCQAAPRKVASTAGTSPGWGVTDDEPDPDEAAGGQRAEERQPVGTFVATGRGDLHAEHGPLAGRADPDRDESRHAHDPATLADLVVQRIERDVRIAGRVERPRVEGVDLGVEPGADPGDLAPAQIGHPCLLYTSPSPRD